MAREVLYRVCYGESDIKHDKTKEKLAAQLKIRPALLRDFCRHKVKYCDYPGIIPEKGQSVRGTYVTGLTDGDVYRLDMFEGSEYTRREVKVELLKENGVDTSEEVAAQTYVFTADPDHRLEKKEWDYAEFRREKMSRWTGQSNEYDDVPEFEYEPGSSEHDPTGGRGVPKQKREVEEEKALDAAV